MKKKICKNMIKKQTEINDADTDRLDWRKSERNKRTNRRLSQPNTSNDVSFISSLSANFYIDDVSFNVSSQSMHFILIDSLFFFFLFSFPYYGILCNVDNF